MKSRSGRWARDGVARGCGAAQTQARSEGSGWAVGVAGRAPTPPDPIVPLEVGAGGSSISIPKDVGSINPRQFTRFNQI